MITATLTRPTAIAPTMSCDKRVLLMEKIDIGHLPPPRSRTIFLEPISKRTRRKRSAVLDKAPVTIPEPPPTGVPNDHASEAGSVERAAASDSARDVHGENSRGHTQIDLRSEVSGESGRSISTAVSRSDITPLSHASTFKSPSKQKIVDNKTITATIELLKGGCLAGDMVSVRVSVQHIKRLKSLTGVIVTLFRQSKIDSAPPASLFSGNDFEAIGDDGYPRSRTGLAGLSLSSTGSTSMFRKDLDQNTAPLIIDPSSLHASVTCSLKLPDDAFPTIRGVPGAMVSFRYHIEVIVDLGGKLSGQMLQGGQQSTTRLGQYMTSGVDNAYGPRVATNIIDTSPLRRQKGVVSVSMETVVGTVDSSRRRKPLRISPRHQTPRVPESDEDDFIRADYERPAVAASPAIYTTPPPGDRHYASQPPSSYPSRAGAGPSGPSQPDYYTHSHLNGHSREAAPAYIPQPHMPDARNMSEKERIRQAETRLLPSQPTAAGPSSSASAPDDDNIYDAHEAPRQNAAGPSAPTEEEAIAGPSAPSEDDLHGSSAFPAEDKQELERQRLINEASAPPEFPEDMERSGDPSPGAEANAEPSAPMLDEDEEELAGYGVGAGPSSSAGPSGSRSSGQLRNGEQLPAYQQ
ncbi:hypothetical protein NLG97_g10447 [Lecanicillium saksenae]|uniref:Uncharacterized protein n=1 Tax=Lecanicillium saksenae TaxID=468837 RepID=A0ACC1QD54_9HYPO|nr:hypothetical protein NLG97_g10447 [Lecanicillium saksenae]